MARRIWLLLVVAGAGCEESSSAPPPPARFGPPTPVEVIAGATTGGIDIAVAAPAAGPAPNAEALGVASSHGLATLSRTGATVSRTGGAVNVVLCGAGLTGDMLVTIGGPTDGLDVGTTAAAACTRSGLGEEVPGIQFTLEVGPGAALGARSVVLRDRRTNDVTAFTGGLEVVP